MAKWFKTLWAASGDKTAVPDALDISGAVSYTEGYNLNYERVLGTDPLARAIERQKLNYVLSDVTGALQQYQTKGFPDYIDAATNGGTAYAYAINAVVRFTDDKNYLNTVAGNTNAPNVSGWVLHDDIASTVHAATSKTTPVDADELGLVDSATSNVLKKLTWANLKSAIGTYIGLTYAPIASPTFTGTPTAPNFSYKPTQVTVTSWSYVTTTITLNVASHAFVAGDYIEVGGLTATTNIPNGVHLVTSITATTVVFTYALTPTGTAGVSSATVKGYMTTNGRTNGIGEGQTWQNVTVSRVSGTIYTNTTGKPIFVRFGVASGQTGDAVVNGIVFSRIDCPAGYNNSGEFIVPNSGVYSITGSFSSWLELR